MITRLSLMRATPLGVPVLKHHLFKVVLRLGISVSEKHCLLCFTDDVGNAEVVAVDGHQPSEWVSGLTFGLATV